MIKAAFRQALAEVLTMPEPSYKVLPKGPKKATLSKRIINHATRSDNRAHAAFHRQYTFFKEHTTYLANRRANERIATIRAKLMKTQESLEKSKTLARSSFRKYAVQ